MELVDEISLLEAELAADAVIARIAIKQTAMFITGIAVTITRLLRKQFRILLRVLISSDDGRARKSFRIENFWERFCIFHTSEEGRNAWCRNGLGTCSARRILGAFIRWRRLRRWRATTRHQEYYDQSDSR